MGRSRAVMCKGGFEPTVKDAIAAVESLYSDRIRPSGRLILKRVGEHAALTFGNVPHIDHKRLRKLCYGCPSLQIEQDGGDYVVFIRGRQPDFVEVSSTVDPFRACFWSDFAVFLATLLGDDARLPGGRYACAQLLAEKQLPILKDRSLGEICHIIELAISRHKLLGYFDGCVVPYSCSEAGQKECCAQWMQPSCTSKRALPQFPIVGWEQARACLCEILEASGGAVPLPNVKRLFHSRFQLELSETFLGHAKVADLLADPRLSDICSLTRHNNGSYLVERKLQESQSPVGLAELMHCTWWQNIVTVEECRMQTPCQSDPRTFEQPEPQFPELHLQSLPNDTANHDDQTYPLSTPTPWCDLSDASCIQAQQSHFAGLLQSEIALTQTPLPVMATPNPWDVQPCTSRFSELLHFESESCGSTAESSAQSCSNENETLRHTACALSDDGEIDSMVQNTFLHIVPTNAVQRGSCRRTKSLPHGFRYAASTSVQSENAAASTASARDELNAQELEITQLRARLASAEAENDALKLRASRSSSASTASGEAVSLSWADEPVEDEELALEADSFEPADSNEGPSPFQYDGWARTRQSDSRAWRANDKLGARHGQWNAVRGGQHRTWRAENYWW